MNHFKDTPWGMWGEWGHSKQKQVPENSRELEYQGGLPPPLSQQDWGTWSGTVPPARGSSLAEKASPAGNS